jgi:hypothetical protein
VDGIAMPWALLYRRVSDSLACARQVLASPALVVAQRYVSNPLLIDGYKFDLRLYLIISSVRPVHVEIYTEGLVRRSLTMLLRSAAQCSAHCGKHSTRCSLDDSKCACESEYCATL